MKALTGRRNFHGGGKVYLRRGALSAFFDLYSLHTPEIVNQIINSCAKFSRILRCSASSLHSHQQE